MLIKENKQSFMNVLSDVISKIEIKTFRFVILLKRAYENKKDRFKSNRLFAIILSILTHYKIFKQSNI